MLRLLLLRHAKAAWPSGVMDLDRPLAGRGQAAAPVMGRYLKDEGLQPDLVIISPARRTQETWSLLQPSLGEVVHQNDGRIYEAPASRLLTVLQEVKPDVHTLLMIGHNPGCEDLARLLAGEGDQDAIERLNQKYPTAGLAVIDFSQGQWREVGRGAGRLERFVTPKLLMGGEDD
jgi:phosphohistidine phosphatase